MLNYIKSEFVKCRIVFVVLLSIVISVVTTFVIKFRLMPYIQDYIDMSEDTYTFIVLCKTFILVILPVFVLLCNMIFSSWEERNNGWRLVLTSKNGRKKIFFAKYMMNTFISFVAYLVIIIAGAIIFSARGSETVFTVVVVPLMCSFLCFIPTCLILQFICILFNSFIEIIFVGIILIVATLLLTQTVYEKYFFICYPYSVAMSFDMVGIRILVCVVLTIVMWSFGTKLLLRHIEK